MSMNVGKLDRKGKEEEVWKEFETFISVDDWWFDE